MSAQQPKCVTCRWFQRGHERYDYVQEYGGGYLKGECRKAAPGPEGFPKATTETWCGEHEARQ